MSEIVRVEMLDADGQRRVWDDPRGLLHLTRSYGWQAAEDQAGRESLESPWREALRDPPATPALWAGDLVPWPTLARSRRVRHIWEDLVFDLGMVTA